MDILKKYADKRIKKKGDDNKDMVMQNISEDNEKKGGEIKGLDLIFIQTNILVEILKDTVPLIQEILRTDHNGDKIKS